MPECEILRYLEHDDATNGLRRCRSCCLFGTGEAKRMFRLPPTSMSHPTITSRVAAETVSLRKNGGETLSSQTVAHAPEPTSQRIIALNSIWNLIGQIAPILVAMCVIPFLVHHLGVDRFGVLTLAWILVGYLSLLDLGIGRATTKLLAEKLALGNTQGARNLVWTAILS